MRSMRPATAVSAVWRSRATVFFCAVPRATSSTAETATSTSRPKPEISTPAMVGRQPQRSPATWALVLSAPPPGAASVMGERAYSTTILTFCPACSLAFSLRPLSARKRSRFSAGPKGRRAAILEAVSPDCTW